MIKTRAITTADVGDPEAIWSRCIPEPNTGCWLWMGTIFKGYGRTSLLFSGTHKSVLAHRASYAAAYGGVVEGMMVCHKCDVRWCVNPQHLFLGTQKDNIDDRERKRRGCYGDRSVFRRNPHIRPRGEQTRTAKLTEGQVREIRARFAAGETRPDLGRAFGVTAANIRYIVTGKYWKHLL